jgi:lipid-binding SYLF domain-containing protein
MKKRKIQILGLVGVILLMASTSFAESKEEKQAEIRKQSSDTLAKLYKAHPSAEAAIKSAAGYATFSNFGMKILLAGGGKGHGMVFNNSTQQITYMKMLEVQAGLGFGAKKFHTIFVFETKEAMDHFVNEVGVWWGSYRCSKGRRKGRCLSGSGLCDAGRLDVPTN